MKMPRAVKYTGFCFFLFALASSLLFFACDNPVIKNPLLEQVFKPRTIVFDTDGGTKIDNQLVYKGDKIIRPKDPQKTGNVFDGWYQDKLFSTEWNFNVVPDKDMTLYAKWDDRGITLSPIGNNGTEDFGWETVGYKNLEPYVVTVTNLSVILPTEGLDIYITGKNPDCFTVSANKIDNIPPGGTATFTVAPITGLDKGDYTATVCVKGVNNIYAEFYVSFSVYRAISELTILTQPAKLVYTYGEPLNLAGLTVHVEYSDGSKDENLPYSLFESVKIVTIPAHNALISVLEYNDQPIQIVGRTLTGTIVRETEKLTVNQKDVTISVGVNNRVYDGTKNATPANIMINGVLSGDDVIVIEGTAEFSDKNIGNSKTVMFSNWSLGGSAAGNYNLAAQPASVSAIITRLQLLMANPSVTLTKVYDGKKDAVAAIGNMLNKVPGDDLVVAIFSSEYNSPNVAEANFITVIYEISGADSGNYIEPANYIANSASITKATPEITEWPSGISATYGDYLRDVPIPKNGVSIQEGTFAWTTPGMRVGVVGTQRHSMTFVPNDSGNYRTVRNDEVGVDDIAVDVKQKDVTINVSVNNREYDGSATAVPSTMPIIGALEGDDVSAVPGTAVFENKNAGVNKNVTFSNWSLGGNAAGNYNLTAQPATVRVTITPRKLIMSDPAVTTIKVYDGNGVAVATIGTMLNKVPGDDLDVNFESVLYNSPNVVSANKIEVKYVISGQEATNGNYEAPDLYPVNATITQATPEITAWPSGMEATYGQTLSQVPIPNNGASYPTGTFAWTTPATLAGTAGTQYHRMTFTPNDNGNYRTVTKDDVGVLVKSAPISSAAIDVTPPKAGYAPDTVAIIKSTPANFTVSAVTWTPVSAVFGIGSYTASVTLTANTNYTFEGGLSTATINGQPATVNSNTGPTAALAFVFETQYVTGIAISVQPKLNYTHGDSLDMSSLAIRLIHNYGNEVNVAFNDFSAYANPSTGAITASMDNGAILYRHTHNTIPITVTYTNSSAPVTVTANTGNLAVNTKTLTISGANAANRIYNGNNSVVLSGGVLQGKVGSDDVAFTLGTGTMANANIGNNKPVTTSIALTGTHAGNYTLTQPSGITVNITPQSLTIADVSAVNRDYNGTVQVGLSGGVLQGIISGDTVISIMGTGTIANAYVGNGKTVTTSITLNGADADNYTLTQPAYVTVDITQAELTIAGASTTKPYDGNKSIVGGITITLAGRFGTDDVLPNNTNVIAEYNDIYAGTVKVNISAVPLLGARANEYRVRLEPDFTVTGGITKTAGAQVSTPSLDTYTQSDTMTIYPVTPPSNGQTVEYAISNANNGTGLSTPQDSITFTGLNTGSAYYVYARSRENNNYSAGAWSPASPVITFNTFAFSFTIEEIKNLNINTTPQGNLVLSRSGNPAKTVTILVQNASSYDIEWRYDNVKIGTGPILTLSVDPGNSNYKFAYDLIGKHTLTVIVKENDVPFSRAIPFEVKQ